MIGVNIMAENCKTCETLAAVANRAKEDQLNSNEELKIAKLGMDAVMSGQYEIHGKDIIWRARLGT